MYKKITNLTVSLTLVLALVLGFASAVTLTAGGDTQIAALSDLYDVNPDVSSCKAGELKDVEKMKILAEINKIRDLHGLPHVEYNYAYDNEAAQIALICAANGTLTHTPDAGMHCYSAEGYAGGITTNLYLASYSGTSLPASENSVVSWMHDDPHQTLGHRRWIINPFVKYMSFGRVDGKPKSGGTWNVSAMSWHYVNNTDANISGLDKDFVAYPYGNYPPYLVKKDWLLSFTVIADKTNKWKNNGNAVNYSNVSIEMTPEGGSKITIASGSYGWDFDGYGIPNCLKWQYPSTLKENITYTVDIKNVKVNGTSKDYSYQFKLTEASVPPPSAPTLASPADGSVEVQLEAELKWNIGDNASGYSVQVSDDSGFSNIINEQSVTGLEFTARDLESLTKYFWRVKASNKGGFSDWSDVWDFTTVKTLPAPSLVSPEKATTDISVNTDFVWMSVPEAVNYSILVANSPDFSGNAVVFSDELNALTVKVSGGALLAETKYYWKVRANSANAPGQWSEVWNFTTAGAGALPPEVVIVGPKGGKKVSLTAVLDWETTPNAVTYDVQVANDPNFGSSWIVVDETGITETEFTLPEGAVEDGKLYYWKVRGVGNAGEGEWTVPPGRFRADATISIHYYSEFDNSNVIQNVPNPCSAGTMFTFNIDLPGNTEIALYNSLGIKVAILTNAFYEAGSYNLNFDTSELPSGVYYYRLMSNDLNVSGMMNVVK
ncbi:MAG: T9SS type A sorting domain-containing protein [Chlorobi bacterium]|nr:T9SS type A sorting domain-containing protein [Chlorobiota bacterium]